MGVNFDYDVYFASLSTDHPMAGRPVNEKLDCKTTLFDLDL